MKAKKFYMANALQAGWSTLQENLSFVVSVILVYLLVGFLPKIILALVQPSLPILVRLIVIIARMLWGLFLMIGLTQIGLRLLDKQECKISHLFGGLDRLFSFLITQLSLIILLCIPLGLAWWLVPAGFWRYAASNPTPLVLGGSVAAVFAFIFLEAYLAIMFYFSGYLVVDKDLGPIDAIARSCHITQNARGDIFIFSVLTAGLNILGLLSLGIGLFITIPLTNLSFLYIYRKCLNFNGEIEPRPAKEGTLHFLAIGGVLALPLLFVGLVLLIGKPLKGLLKHSSRASQTISNRVIGQEVRIKGQKILTPPDSWMAVPVSTDEKTGIYYQLMYNHLAASGKPSPNVTIAWLPIAVPADIPATQRDLIAEQVLNRLNELQMAPLKAFTEKFAKGSAQGQASISDIQKKLQAGSLKTGTAAIKQSGKPGFVAYVTTADKSTQRHRIIPFENGLLVISDTCPASLTPADARTMLDPLLKSIVLTFP